jgi:hypothetical protein
MDEVRESLVDILDARHIEHLRPQRRADGNRGLNPAHS